MEANIEQLLNNLNNVNNLNLSEPILEDEVLETINEEDIDINISYPKVIITQKDLIRALNLCSSIVQSKSDNIVYNSITFISKGNLKIFSTNELSHFIMNISCIGDNSLDLVFSVPLVLLQKLTKLMGNKIMFFIKENRLYIRLLSGDLLLDIRIPEEHMLRIPVKEEQITETYEIPLGTLGRVTSSIYPILNTEIRTDARKISFLGDKAYYMSPYYYIESNIKTPNMSLRMKDAEFICKLYKFYPDKNIFISLVNSKVPRIQIKLENITYIFISGNASMDNLVASQIEKLVQPISIIFNFDRFNKIINLATLLPNSTGNIRLSIDESNLIINLMSNSGESTFNVPYELVHKTKNDNMITVCAESLKKLLASFNDSAKIGLAFTDYGIVLEKEGVKAILMHNVD